MSLSQTEIVQRAERLATELVGMGVEKNALLSVVADFMSDPRGDVERLRRMLKLLKDGSGGHLKRSASYVQQIKALAEGLQETLDDRGLSPVDLKSLFGWTARLLLVRGEGEGWQPVREGAGRRGAPDRAAARPAQAPPKPAFGSLGKKGLSELETFKADLEKKEKG
jgi:hypothetical protein